MGKEMPAEYYSEHMSNFLAPYEDSLWKAVYDATVSLVPSDKSVRIVDIGCGTGRLAEALKRAGYTNYVGFDFASKRVEEARKYLPTHDFRVLDMFSPEAEALIKDADVLTITEVLEHIENDIGLLKSIPIDKTIIFSVPNFGGPTHVRHFKDMAAVEARFAPFLDIEWDSAVSVEKRNKNNKTFICRGKRRTRMNRLLHRLGISK